MIAYDLQCANGHGFEGWFEDRNAFERQRRKKIIACPVCNNPDVSIVPSAFAIKKDAAASPPPPENPAAQEVPSVHQIVDFLEKNFDNVGSQFANEALKMHYGVSEKRNIRGTSTKSEEETLEKEGVKFFKVPIPRLDS